MIAMSHSLIAVIGLPAVPTAMYYAFKLSVIVHFDYTTKRGIFR